jgi:hypothetical protein
MNSGFSRQPIRPPPSPGGAEVEYVLDEEDYAECYRHLAAAAAARAGQRNVWLQFIPAAFLASLGVAVLAFTVSARLRGIEGDGLWLMAFIALGLLAVAGWLVWQTCRVMYSRGRSAMRRAVQQRRVAGIVQPGRRDRAVLHPDGFVEFNDGGVRVRANKSTEVSWSAVERIDTTGEHLIITVRAKGYLFVPRRAFADDGAFALFVETARRYEEFPRRLSAEGRPRSPAADGDAITRKTDE